MLEKVHYISRLGRTSFRQKSCGHINDLPYYYLLGFFLLLPFFIISFSEATPIFWEKPKTFLYSYYQSLSLQGVVVGQKIQAAVIPSHSSRFLRKAWRSNTKKIYLFGREVCKNQIYPTDGGGKNSFGSSCNRRSYPKFAQSWKKSQPKFVVCVRLYFFSWCNLARQKFAALIYIQGFFVEYRLDLGAGPWKKVLLQIGFVIFQSLFSCH